MADSYETPNMYPNLSAPLCDQQQFRLNRINEIKDQFVAEIKERELMTKTLSKYIASFNYFDTSLIVLSITTGSISIASFSTVECKFQSCIFDIYGNCRKTVKNNKK